MASLLSLAWTTIVTGLNVGFVYLEEDSAVLQELERTLALLAFEDPASCPFSDLLAPSHRQQVGDSKSSFWKM